jgi:hypothetical protein
VSEQIPTQQDMRDRFTAEFEQARQRAEADAAARQEQARQFIEGLGDDTQGRTVE